MPRLLVFEKLCYASRQLTVVYLLYFRGFLEKVFCRIAGPSFHTTLLSESFLGFVLFHCFSSPDAYPGSQEFLPYHKNYFDSLFEGLDSGRLPYQYASLNSRDITSTGVGAPNP